MKNVFEFLRNTRERIERSIYWIRGQKIMLDADLAALYGVETKVLNQAVKRNRERFPEDFMFQLSWDEPENLRSQAVTLKQGTMSSIDLMLSPNRG
jgi:hypothetical protein